MKKIEPSMLSNPNPLPIIIIKGVHCNVKVENNSDDGEPKPSSLKLRKLTLAPYKGTQGVEYKKEEADKKNIEQESNKLLLLTQTPKTSNEVSPISLLEKKCKGLEERLEALEKALHQEQIKRAELEKKLFEWNGDLLMYRLSSLDTKLDTVLTEVQTNSQPTPVSALQAAVLKDDDNLCEGLEVKGDKVNLGLNVYCTLSSWMTLNKVSQLTDWVTTLLKGVFGDEAKLYRKQPKNDSLRAFPMAFLEVAKIHFKTFLDRRMKELEKEDNVLSKSTLNFFSKNYDTLLQQLPASLSDKAYDMGRCEQRAAKRKSNAANGNAKTKVERLQNVTPQRKTRKSAIHLKRSLSPETFISIETEDEELRK